MMTLSDVAELTHLGWESVKNIVKADLGRGYASIPMKEVTRIAIDEKHLGKKAKFITLVVSVKPSPVVSRLTWRARATHRRLSFGPVLGAGWLDRWPRLGV